MTSSDATPTNPVARVVALLIANGFQEAPATIGGISFRFAAILQGSRSLDLVVVVDTALQAPEMSIRGQVVGLAQALDLLKSRRSLTVVFVGPRPSSALSNGTGAVARILYAGNPGENDVSELELALGPLLPLRLTKSHDETEYSWALRRADILARYPQEVTELVLVARFGGDAVERMVGEQLNAPLEPVQTIYEERGPTK